LRVTFDELASSTAGGPELSHFSRRKMFGRDGLMFDGKAVLCSDPEGVVFRVGPEHEAAALSVPGAGGWSPMGSGGPGPKGWIVVPPGAQEEWPRLAGLALEFVKTVKK
jgi:hypothetical protein